MRKARILAYRVAMSPPVPLVGGPLAERQGLLLELREGARIGLGEAAPLPGFSPGTLAQALADLRALAGRWLAGDSSPAPVCSPAADFAFSAALAELDAGPLVADPGRHLCPLLSGDLAAREQRWTELRCQRPAIVKVKPGREDVEREAALLNRMVAEHPGLRLRLDPNRRWAPEQAVRFARALDERTRAAIDYIEEPCGTLVESGCFAAESGLPLALDESLVEAGERWPEVPELAALVLKPTLLGSLARLERWLAEAAAEGIRTVLSSAFESPLAVGQLAALARRLTPDEPPGLDTLGPWPVDLLRPLPGSARPLLPAQRLECLWQS